MTTGWRVQRHDEPAEALLVGRADGWVVEGDRQLPGVACCASLADLASYVRRYGLSVQPGDRLVIVDGRDAGDDLDAGAIRVEPLSARDVGDATYVLSRIARAPDCDSRDAAAVRWESRLS